MIKNLSLILFLLPYVAQAGLKTTEFPMIVDGFIRKDDVSNKITFTSHDLQGVYRGSLVLSCQKTDGDHDKEFLFLEQESILPPYKVLYLIDSIELIPTERTSIGYVLYPNMMNQQNIESKIRLFPNLSEQSKFGISVRITMLHILDKEGSLPYITIQTQAVTFDMFQPVEIASATSHTESPNIVDSVFRLGNIQLASGGNSLGNSAAGNSAAQSFSEETLDSYQEENSDEAYSDHEKAVNIESEEVAADGVAGIFTLDP